MARLRQALLWMVLTIGCAGAYGGSAIDVDEFEFQGHPVRLETVPEPAGLVFVFHGSGGGVGFLTRDVTRHAIAPMQRAGYAIVATESAQRDEPRRWNTRDDDPRTNVDLARLLALYGHLADERGLALPVYTMGMSNGAFMAMLFAGVAATEGIPVRAAAAHQGGIAAPALAARDYRIPTFYVLVANDQLVDNARVATGCQYLRDRGVACGLHLVSETPLSADHLTAEGVADDAAQDVFAVLVRIGYIDATGVRRVAVDRHSTRQGWEDEMRHAGISDPATVFDALRQSWAFHLMRREFGAQQLAFFESQRPARDRDIDSE
jgi:dienelactone hydrolase